MKNNIFCFVTGLAVLLVLLDGCSVPAYTLRDPAANMPGNFYGDGDSANSANINWRTYFEDPYLIALIDTALRNNQELNIMQLEIDIANNEVMARKGEYLPFVNIGAAAGLDKVGRYTRSGAVEEQLDIREDEHFPEPLGEFSAGVLASWEVDVWRKLRNARQSAASRYLAGIEGRNFMVTNLVAEIASSYYELMALDNLLGIIDQNIQIQSDALNVVKQQKDAAKVSQLAVNRFEAQLLNTRNLQFEVKQRIVETENKINFLTARYPTPIPRGSGSFLDIQTKAISSGVPAQLLVNRPDIREAELNLAASKLDVKVARANFYPSVDITAGLGFEAFNPVYLVQPESMLYNLAGDLMAPLVNRNAIKATYNTANAQQMQAVFTYEQTVLEAYVDVLNQLSKMDNYSKSYETKSQEVDILMESVGIANSLFYSARADYAEVLLTQREALEAKLELVEIKSQLLLARVNIYRSLGGGWK
ncbi:MAG: efflux transporter outer membrane subunit [Flavobacteriales bacterium]|nr:efflux transporter outer membrane subunit [Flavobacteriales bacterium]